jgi:hypothetical protein
MRVVDEKALARITGLSAGNAVYDRIVNRSAREFIARVTMPAAH